MDAFDGFFGSLASMEQEDLEAINSALAPMADDLQVAHTDAMLNKTAAQSLQASQQDYSELASATQSNANAHMLLQQQQQQPQNSFTKHSHPYPTPNSASMFAAAERPYMSPFPDPGSAAALAFSQEIDELLFTPMMSPAMTPMQHAFAQASQDIDWERFDQGMFALTGPAMDTQQQQLQQQQQGQVRTPTMEMEQAPLMSSPLHPPSVQQQQPVPAPPSAKRQRLGRKASIPNAIGKVPTLSAASKHKRKTTSMSAPLLRKGASSLEPSPEPNHKALDAATPRLAPLPGQAQSQSQGHAVSRSTSALDERFDHPITPSMLMSLSNTNGTSNHTSPALVPVPASHLVPRVDTAPAKRFPAPITTSNLNAVPFRSNSQPSTPASATAAFTSRPAATPIAIAPPPPPPIAAKKQTSFTGSVPHSRSGSVANSPALGPSHPARNSPDLRPILPGGMSPQVSALLASKSNYQHILDGTLNQMGVSYPQGMTAGLENRRTSHKQAEQKRRDHLKESFELLRNILPDRPEAGASKVVLLRKGYEYIVQCQDEVRKQGQEIARLRQLAGLPAHEEKEPVAATVKEVSSSTSTSGSGSSGDAISDGKSGSSDRDGAGSQSEMETAAGDDKRT